MNRKIKRENKKEIKDIGKTPVVEGSGKKGNQKKESEGECCDG